MKKAAALLALGSLVVVCLSQFSPPAALLAVPQARLEAAYQAPITFYGKVADQFGNPVAGANVEMRVNDSSSRKGRVLKLTADAQGVFSIADVAGLSLYVSVSKAGYYRVRTQDGKRGSEDGFAYGEDLGHGIHKPEPGNPAIFLLQKEGVKETLVRQKEVDRRIAKDGSPLQFLLGDGNASHAIVLQCWTQDENVITGGQYDWHMKVTVPHGGLIPRVGDFAFEAPQDGYVSADEYTMAKSTPSAQWKDFVEKSYFVRFADGVYARVNVRILAYGAHSAVFSSYLNPKPGSRNLEEDPRKR
ncbi:MAG: carboxypeptidase-like regulatory domain-containing protein [Prosthecobacter sp.]